MKLLFSTQDLARLMAGGSKAMFKFPTSDAIALLLGPTIGAVQDLDAAMAGQK